MPRINVRYDPTTPEGQQIAAWLSRQANQSEAIRDLILSDIDKQDNLSRIVQAVEQTLDRKLRDLAIVKQQAERPGQPTENAVLAKKLDDMF